MAKRPSDIWRSNVADDAAALAEGRLDPEEAFYATLFPPSLIDATDRTLAAFEQRVRALDTTAGDQIMQAVQAVVLALNAVNDEHNQSGYETGERELLCTYIDQTLTEAGIDVPALAARHHVGRWEITDRWRKW